jgi:hypothetical protein
VFEFLSDSNTPSEMANKAMFFDRYGVQEYYIYDIERRQLGGFIRYAEEDDHLEEIVGMNGWKSPRLGITFDINSGDLILRKPEGTPFLSYEEYVLLEKIVDDTRTELGETQERLSVTKRRADALAARLRELGVNPEEIV